MRAATPREALALFRATDPRNYAAPIPLDISEAALQARQRFALDAEIAQADRDFPTLDQPQTTKGGGGVRLRSRLKADISDDLLREFARDTLGAQRCSQKYLDALRIVLGNQADAERKGYVLELNRRVPFASEKVMRTIIGQMQEAGVTFGAVVGLGDGRCQTVQCFDNSERVPYLRDDASREVADRWLGRMDRVHEAKDDARRLQFVGPHRPAVIPTNITAADVPY